jgi:hypothetical protein
LQPWGFEIYAAIDAYSRCIIWVYVGISGLTGRSVLAQYVAAIREHGCVLFMIRSDRGNETLLLSMAHYFLAQALAEFRQFKLYRNKERKPDIRPI